MTPASPGRILPRAVHVGQPHDRVPGLVQPVVQADVLLGAVLGQPVRRLRQRQGVLGRGDGRLPPVDGPAGGGEHHPGVHGPGRLEDVDRPQDVDLVVVGRRFDRDPDVDLRGQMADQLRPGPGHHRAERGRVADTDLMQVDLAVQAFRPSGRQVVEHGHLVAPVQERIGEVRSDETGTARHEYAHGGPPLLGSRACQGWCRGPGRLVSRIFGWWSQGSCQSSTSRAVSPCCSASASRVSGR